MATYVAPRMQTNADWVAQFTFSGADDISSWTISGRAQSTKARGAGVDLVQGQHLTIVGPATVQVSLSVTDCSHLGACTVEFELMRETPTPVRPFLRFQIQNHQGLGD
jgi:hypothetical protein